MSLVFFTDRDLGRQFPAVLVRAGLHVERHVDHFTPDASDETWLRAAGDHGWIAITHDARIRYKPNELLAVERFRVRLPVVIDKVPFHELAQSFIATLPSIEAFLARHDPPLIGKVYRATPRELQRDPGARGRVELWYPR